MLASVLNTARTVVGRGLGTSSHAPAATGPPTVRILTYNLWFAEHVALKERMQGLVDIIQDTEPDVMMFQEVTPTILKLLVTQHSKVFSQYTISQPPRTGYFTILALRKLGVTLQQGIQRLPFYCSYMDRDLLSVPLTVPGYPNCPVLLVATSHLESPLGEAKPNDKERELQLKEGSEELEKSAQEVADKQTKPGLDEVQPVDIVWGGDMNWISTQGDPELPTHWQDVWQVHHPNDPGMTWDTTMNDMIKDEPFPPARMDRFFARLQNWQVQSVKLVGTQPLPGVEYVEDSRPRQVLVSDHYGVLLTLHCPGLTYQPDKHIQDQEDGYTTP